MLDIPIIAVVPQRLVTNDTIIHIITKKDFTLITILKFTYFTILIMLKVKTIIQSQMLHYLSYRRPYLEP